MSTDTATTTAGTPASSSETTAAASTAGQTTDQTQAGSAATSADGGGQTGQTEVKTDDTPWQDRLAGDLATDPLFRTYKTVDELAKAHQHLTKLKGATAAELLKIPSKTQSEAPDDWAPIYKALGVPDDPKDYKIELAPEAAADTPELANILRDLGGKAHLSHDAMGVVVETLNELGKKAGEAEAAEKAALKTETTAALDKEWGAAREANDRAIGKLIRDANGGQLDDAAMADLSDQLASNLTLLRALGYAVSKMAEPEAPEGGGRETGAPKAMTPKQATAALNAFHADPEKMKALQTKGHPMHAAALAERAALLAQQRGEARPDQPS